MSAIGISLAAWLIRLSQYTPFCGRGSDFGASSGQIYSADVRNRFRQAFAEAPQVGDFYKIFPGLEQEIAGKNVLDFGCGYGGKTVEYARSARFVAGIEPFDQPVLLARGYARSMKCPNVEFRVCAHDSIPYADDSFDLVLGHDVLEHVRDPSVSLAEIARVLRPGGRAFIAFPPYDGMFSHHLDYASSLPGLHWLFRPQTLVKAVNAVRDLTGMDLQPEPKPSWDGKRMVLPSLNGLTGEQFERLAASFADASIEYRPIGWTRDGAVAMVRDWILHPLAKAGFRDQMTSSIAAVLTRAPAAPRHRVS